MSKIECPICQEVLSARGIRGHLRFKHKYSGDEIQEILNGAQYIPDTDNSTGIMTAPKQTVEVTSPVRRDNLNNPSLQVLREEVERERLNRELENIKNPQAQLSHMDMFQALLTQQQQHNEMMMTKQNQLFEKEKELLRLKYSEGEGDWDWLQDYAPDLIEVLKAKFGEQQTVSQTSFPAVVNQNDTNIREDTPPDITGIENNQSDIVETPE
jgi:hypothetical protein